MRFEKHINGFGEYLLMKGYSERTKESYTFELSKFVRFLDEHYSRIKDVSQINKDILFDYSNYLSCYRNNLNKGYGCQTLKVKIASLKHFFKYLAKYDFVLKNPALYLDSPKEEKVLPRSVLTEKEVMQLLDSINTNTPLGLRNKTVLEVFYSSGMRTSELCDLKICDVDLKEQIAIIRKGKGNKTRVVPIGQYATEYIKLYLEKARKFMLRGTLKDEGYLFLSSQGNPFNRETINKCVIATVVKNAKIGKKITCYTFRHSVATHLIKNKVDLRYVSELLGHSSLKTTQKYCHLEISDLKKMHALYHPREID